MLIVAFRPEHPASFDQNHADDQEVFHPTPHVKSSTVGFVS
jgi:hypothetical protein